MVCKKRLVGSDGFSVRESDDHISLVVDWMRALHLKSWLLSLSLSLSLSISQQVSRPACMQT